MIKKMFPLYTRPLNLQNEAYKFTLDTVLYDYSKLPNELKESGIDYGAFIIGSMRKNLNNYIARGMVSVDKISDEHVSEPNLKANIKKTATSILKSANSKEKDRNHGKLEKLPALGYSRDNQGEPILLFYDPGTNQLKQWNGPVEMPVYATKPDFNEDPLISKFFKTYSALLKTEVTSRIKSQNDETLFEKLKDESVASVFETIIEGHKRMINELHNKENSLINSLRYDTNEAFNYAVDELNKIQLPALIQNKRLAKRTMIYEQEKNRIRTGRKHAIQKIREIQEIVNKEYRIDPSRQELMNELFTAARQGVRGNKEFTTYSYVEKDGKMYIRTEKKKGHSSGFKINPAAKNYFKYNNNIAIQGVMKNATDNEQVVINEFLSHLAAYVFKEKIESPESDIFHKPNHDIKQDYIVTLLKEYRKKDIDELLAKDIKGKDLIKKLNKIKKSVLGSHEHKLNGVGDVLLKRENYLNGELVKNTTS
ncbi:MAG: hypothetical protein PHH61_05205 [Candidatus Nanoarchaeia archaeon]|nr:hypothetical protein [Candidatus Nanoarchaeia archaeon]